MLVARHAHATSGPGHRVAATDPLTATGRRQAGELADHVGTLDATPDVVVCSTAVRARETAEVCGARLGIPLRTDDRLCDRAGRDGRPLPYTLAEQSSLRPLDDVWEAADTTWDGETLGQFWSRVRAAADDLATAASAPLVVCHLGTVTALVRWALDLPETLPDRFALPVGNASLTELRFRTDRAGRRRVALVAVGEAGFLREPTPG